MEDWKIFPSSSNRNRRNQMEDWKIFPSSSHQKSNGRLKDISHLPITVVATVTRCRRRCFLLPVRAYTSLLCSVPEDRSTTAHLLVACLDFPFKGAGKPPKTVLWFLDFVFMVLLKIGFYALQCYF